MDQPALYVFFGLIASGKSTLAELFAATHDFPYYNTDRVRKELAGIAANERRPDGMGQGIYTPEFNERTYQTMLDSAAQDFNKGATGVVLDGSYSKATDRHKVSELASALTARILFYPLLLFRTGDATSSCPAGSRSECRFRRTLGDLCPAKDNFEQPDELPPHQFTTY